jgi:hypothetical protein
MSHRVLVSVSAVAVLVAVVSLGVESAAAQTAMLRTAWGHPDLQGIWDFSTITPLERLEELADKEFWTTEEAANLEQEVVERDSRLLTRTAERTEAATQIDFRADGTPGFYNNFWLDAGSKIDSTGRTSQVVDPPNGRLPALTASAQQRVDARRAYLGEHAADSWLEQSTSDRCLMGFNAGPPISPGFYNQNLQVLQTPDHVALLTEMIHTVRVVPLDGRAPLRENIDQWSGDSRGRWEGDTLVVETTNFNGKSQWKNSTGNMTLVERITRVDPDTLEYTYTVTDQETWTSPWTASISLQRTDASMYEYACHEGNYAMPNILAGQRSAEKAEKP